MKNYQRKRIYNLKIVKYNNMIIKYKISRIYNKKIYIINKISLWMNQNRIKTFKLHKRPIKIIYKIIRTI